MEHVYAVIMAGGSGTRFWPLSTKEHPKQSLSLLSEKPLIQDTVERLYKLINKENVYIVTNADLKEKMIEVLPETNFIVEPCARDTTGAIGLACIEIIKKDPEAIIFTETADHIYDNIEDYHNTVKKTIGLAKENKIVTIGVKPRNPATRFGYIKRGEKYKEGFLVDSFREKPNKDTAEKFVEDGSYFWNSGMYIFKAKKMLEELEKYQPEIYKHLENISKGGDLAKEFEAMESISIDYSISEKSKDLVVFTSEMHWDDLGKLDMLEVINTPNREGNVVVGRHIGYESKGNIIYGNGKLIATAGVDNLIIIQTDKATFICPKDKADNVKKIVQRLKREGMNEYL